MPVDTDSRGSSVHLGTNFIRGKVCLGGGDLLGATPKG
jgi:hypothetical protein